MKKLTKEEFLERARSVHGNKYDYSKVEYINSKTKVCIICPKHGEFWQTPNDHLDNHGCMECKKDAQSKSQLKNTSWFIKKAIGIHGDKYDYSKTEYKGSHSYVSITCPKHGVYSMKAYAHLNGQGCPQCSHRSTKYSKEEWIEAATKKHLGKYNYSKVNYVDKDTKVCIICPKHGEFWQSPHNHLNGQGCPKCKKSKLESLVMHCLDQNHIQYIYQYRNTEILDAQTLDFYLPELNTGIECQGIQHFEPVSFTKNITIDESFAKVKERDEAKIVKCEKNGVKLIHYHPFIEYFGTYKNEAHNVDELKKILMD